MFQVMYMHEALCCILDKGRLCHRSSRLWEKGLACSRGGAPQPAVEDLVVGSRPLLRLRQVCVEPPSLTG